MKQSIGCLRYWDLCSTVSLDAAIALWCNVEPSELKELNFSTSCMSAKREAIIDALRDNRLEYEDRPVPRNDGKGFWSGAPLDELIQKDGLRIKKDSLRRWFLDMPFGDKPDFLFEESRREELPDGGDVAEMNTIKALAIMAWLLSENKPAMQIGGRPNAAMIGKEVAILAKKVYGENRGFDSFHKKISKAITHIDEENHQKKPF